MSESSSARLFLQPCDRDELHEGRLIIWTPTSWYKLLTVEKGSKPNVFRVLELIESTDFGISSQVFQEFCVALTRTTEAALSAKEAFQWIELLEAFPVCLSIRRWSS